MVILNLFANPCHNEQRYTLVVYNIICNLDALKLPSENLLRKRTHQNLEVRWDAKTTHLPWSYKRNVHSVIGSSRTLIAPCLDAQLAAVSTANEPMSGNSMLEDDQSNAPRLFATLGSILEEKKVAAYFKRPTISQQYFLSTDRFQWSGRLISSKFDFLIKWRPANIFFTEGKRWQTRPTSHLPDHCCPLHFAALCG